MLLTIISLILSLLGVMVCAAITWQSTKTFFKLSLLSLFGVLFGMSLFVTEKKYIEHTPDKIGVDTVAVVPIWERPVLMRNRITQRPRESPPMILKSETKGFMTKQLKISHTM